MKTTRILGLGHLVAFTLISISSCGSPPCAEGESCGDGDPSDGSTADGGTTVQDGASNDGASSQDGGGRSDGGRSDAGDRDGGTADDGGSLGDGGTSDGGSLGDGGSSDSGTDSGSVFPGGCISGATGNYAARFRWAGNGPSSRAYVQYDLNNFPDASRWRAGAYSRGAVGLSLIHISEPTRPY